MNKTKKFFNDVASYSFSNFFANILNFITGVVVRKILQPTMMGLFNEIMLVFEYARYSQLGMTEALDKELPYFYGKKDHKRFEILKNAGFTFSLTIILCVVISILVASFFIEFSGDRLFLNGIRIISIMLVLRLVSSLYIVLNRSRNNFSVISRYTLLAAFLDTIFKIILTIKFGLCGLLWSSIFTLIVGLLYFYKVSNEKFRFVFNFPFKEIMRLLKIGFPLFIMGFIAMTLRNIDRIMVIKLLTRENLGFYTIALMMSAYAVQLPSLVYAVIFPRFYQAYGKKGNIFAIKELFMKPMFVFAYLFPVLIGIIIIGLPLLINYLLPAYISGFVPAYILLLGSSFLALVNMSGYLLTALDKQIYIVIIGFVSIVIAAALNYLLVVGFHLGLPGIAMGTAVTYFLYTTVVIIAAFKNYTKNIVVHLKFFAELYFPFIWAVAWLVILQAFVFNASGSFFRDLSIVFCKGIIFLIACLPLVYYANRKTKIMTLLKSAYAKNIVTGG